MVFPGALKICIASGTYYFSGTHWLTEDLLYAVDYAFKVDPFRKDLIRDLLICETNKDLLFVDMSQINFGAVVDKLIPMCHRHLDYHK